MGWIRSMLVVALMALGLACLEAGEFEPFPCNSFGECPGDLFCLDGMCRTTWPKGVFGHLCQTSADCEAPYSTCLVKTYSVTGVCSKGCGNRWDCPQGARCIPLDQGPMCMPACERNSDCDELLFCLYRTQYGGYSYCYPLGPPDGADLLEQCSLQPCRDELRCIADEFTRIPRCLHLCHPEDFLEWEAKTCRYRDMHGACDWIVVDPDAQNFSEIGAACSPRCDTAAAREACVSAGWRCYPPGVDDGVCWPEGRE